MPVLACGFLRLTCCSQRFERAACQAKREPLIQLDGPEGTVKRDAWRVPVETLPFQAAAAFFPRNLPKTPEERFAEAVVAVCGFDK